MNKQNLKKLLDDFTSASAARKPLSKKFADLQRDAIHFMQSRDSRFANAGDIFESLDLFIGGCTKRDDQAAARRYIEALTKAKANAHEAGKIEREAKEELTAVVRELYSAKMMEILHKRRLVQDEIVTFLTPYCSSAQEAMEITQECGRLKELEFESMKYRNIRDLESAAAEFLKLNF